MTRHIIATALALAPALLAVTTGVWFVQAEDERLHLVTGSVLLALGFAWFMWVAPGVLA